MSSSFDEFRAGLDDEDRLSVVSWHVRASEGEVSIGVAAPDVPGDDSSFRMARLQLHGVRAMSISSLSRSFGVDSCTVSTDHAQLWRYGPSAEVRCAAAVPKPLEFALELSDWLLRVGAGTELRRYTRVRSLQAFVDRLSGAQYTLLVGPMPLVAEASRRLSDLRVDHRIVPSRVEAKPMVVLTLGRSWVVCRDVAVADRQS